MGIYAFRHYRGSPITARLRALGKAKTSPVVQPVGQSPAATLLVPKESRPQQEAATSPLPVSGVASPPAVQTESPRMSAQSPATATNRPVSPASSAVGFEVGVFARENSWISVVADGKQLMRGILNAKQSMSFRAREKMMLVAGNSGGVDVSFNGKPLPSLGDTRTPRTVSFTSEGMMP
jgi:hypothetical protein